MSYYQNHVGEDRALESIDAQLQDNGIEEDIIIHCDEPSDLENEASVAECQAVEDLFKDFFKRHVEKFELTKFLLGAAIFSLDKKSVYDELTWLRKVLYVHEGY